MFSLKNWTEILISLQYTDRMKLFHTICFKLEKQHWFHSSCARCFNHKLSNYFLTFFYSGKLNKLVDIWADFHSSSWQSGVGIQKKKNIFFTPLESSVTQNRSDYRQLTFIFSQIVLRIIYLIFFHLTNVPLMKKVTAMLDTTGTDIYTVESRILFTGFSI